MFSSGFGGDFGGDFNSGFTSFTPDHAYQAYSVDELHRFEPLKPEPYKGDTYLPKPYTPELAKPKLPKAVPHKLSAGPNYNYEVPNFRPPVQSKPYNKKSHEVIKVKHFEPKPQSYHESSYQEPSGFHAPPSSSSFHESSTFQELNPFHQSNSNFMAEPFLQSESFPESQPFFSRAHSTESYNQPEPIVHPVKTFHDPTTEFFGELSPRPRDAVLSSVPQRSRPGPQPAFRSDPLESFPSFSGPSFDTFLLGEAGDGPGAQVNQPTFSSFTSPPSSLGQQRSREGSAR